MRRFLQERQLKSLKAVHITSNLCVFILFYFILSDKNIENLLKINAEAILMRKQFDVMHSKTQKRLLGEQKDTEK